MPIAIGGLSCFDEHLGAHRFAFAELPRLGARPGHRDRRWLEAASFARLDVTRDAVESEDALVRRARGRSR